MKKKIYPISYSHNGVHLQGEIHYSAKSYKVVLMHPFAGESDSSQMMYAIPAKFVTPLDEPESGSIKAVSIVASGEKKLLEMWQRYEPRSQIDFIRHLIETHRLEWQKPYKLLGSDDIQVQKREAKRRFLAGELANQEEYSALLKELRIQHEERRKQVLRVFEKYDLWSCEKVLLWAGLTVS